MNDPIDRLIERYRDIVHSPENRRRRGLWEDPHRWNRDMWRGVPVPRSQSDPVPFTIELDNSLWSRVLGFSLAEYYRDPDLFLEIQLRKRIFSFENFDDDAYYSDELFIWFGVITELSILGAPIQWFPHKEGWISGALLEDPAGLDRMEPPDFRAGGLMPRVHRYYERLSDLSRGRLRVMFPQWVRGPFCLAMHLRGVSEILVDMMILPDFFHRLMRFVTDSRLAWDRDRELFLGEKSGPGKLYNDEIDCPTLSPELYRDMIFPYEKELGEAYGGISYWHSCGNTTAFQEQIARLPNLELYHCGPWTDFGSALKTMNPATAVDLCLDPQRDVVEASPEEMRRRLEEILRTGGGGRYSVRADAFMPTGPNHGIILEKIGLWNKEARRVLSGR